METTITRFLIEDRLAELRRAADDERLVRSARAAGGAGEVSPATPTTSPGMPARPTVRRH